MATAAGELLPENLKNEAANVSFSVGGACKPSIIRLVLFAALFIYSAAVPRVNADELTGSPPPLPLAVGEHIAADVVNLIFLIDKNGRELQLGGRANEID